MSSKYDEYWLKKLDSISKLIEEARIYGISSEIDVSDIKKYGNRRNWYGTVIVSDKIYKGEMAHARSLGRIVFEKGLVKSYTFRFVISSNLKLKVVKLSSTNETPDSRHSSESKTIEEIEDKKKSIAKILSTIPLDVWNHIVKEEPEWSYMKHFLDRYGFGPFATLMVATGLNDFKLKGKAEVSYWPKIASILESSYTPKSPKELYLILKRFYKTELYGNLKINRLNRFLSSPLAEKLWNSTPKAVSEDFPNIWRELAYTMRQNPEAKTIAFAMKCLGISLLMVEEYNFDFGNIPIPVDFRVRKFSERAGLVISGDDDEIRQIWQEVLDFIRAKEPKVTMIHLDSLIWQIGTKRKHEILDYFVKLGIEDVGKKIVEMIR